jgi:hypothetical protein
VRHSETKYDKVRHSETQYDTVRQSRQSRQNLNTNLGLLYPHASILLQVVEELDTAKSSHNCTVGTPINIRVVITQAAEKAKAPRSNEETRKIMVSFGKIEIREYSRK